MELIYNSNQFKNLDEILQFFKPKISYTCMKTHNIWDVSHGDKVNNCILIKKNALYGIKIDFSDAENILLRPVVPSSFLVTFTVGRGIVPPLVRLFLSKGQAKLLDEVRLLL